MLDIDMRRLPDAADQESRMHREMRPAFFFKRY